MKTRTQNGFTLYELLITFLVVGVIITLGLPNLQAFTANSRMTGTANDLHASFQMARSGAARAKTNVTICPSTNSLDADAICGGTWEQGYIVFLDQNGDAARDIVNDSLLRTHSAIATGVTLRIVGGADFFGYAPTGLGRGDVGAKIAVSRIVMCDDRGNEPAAGNNSAARLFRVTPLGRATILRNMDEIDLALDEMGVTCP